MNDIALPERLLSDIHAALQANTLKLPTLPDIAIRIGILAQDDDATTAQFAEVIRTDPAIAARLLRVANCAAYRGRNDILSLEQALTRLGTVRVRDLARAFSLEGAFISENATLSALMRDNWALSTQIAALVSVLASKLTRHAPEEALLAGLLHRIGVLPVLMFIGRDRSQSLGPAALAPVVEQAQGRAGALVLNTWRFPPEIVRVPEGCLDLQRQRAGGPDLIDLVQAAHWQRRRWDGAGGALHPADVPAPALQRLGLDPERDALAQGDLREQYAQVLAALSA